MVFQSPGDILFRVFDFPVYYYGLILAASCLIGVYTAFLFFKKYNPDKDYNAIWDFSAYIIIAGILGARLYYCLLNPVYYFYHPGEILFIRQGGLSIHGGVTVGILLLIILAKKHKLPVWNLLDAFVCGTAIAQAIGRWGNFFNSEAFGFPTNLPWKLFIPLSRRPVEYADYNFFHPAFLYESILDLIIFIFLFFAIKKFAKKQPGVTFCLYLTLYSLVRIFTEYIRIDSALNLYGIPVAQIISVCWIIIALVIMLLLYRKNHNLYG